MLILGFQVNVMEDGQIKVIYDVILAGLILILIAKNWSARFVVVFVIFVCVGLLTKDMLKWIYISISFYFGVLLISKYKGKVAGFLIAMVLLNFAIVVLQILGVADVFYEFQDYYGTGNHVNLFFSGDDLSWLPLPQLRPSGIFPSTIYISTFQFVLTAYFFLNKQYAGKFFYFLLALFFVSTGSTTSLLLAIGIYLFGENRPASRWFFSCFVVSAIAFYALMPPLFFTYNFSLHIMSSFESRLLFEQALDDNAGSSAFKKYAYPFVGAIVLGGLYLRFAWNLDLRKIIFICILIFGPLVVHDLLTSIFYWFYLGCIYGHTMLIQSRVVNQSAKLKSRPKRFLNASEAPSQ